MINNLPYSGRMLRQYPMGNYPWKIRPGFVGSGGGRAFATCTATATNSYPIPPDEEPTSTVVYGSQAPFSSGTLPDLSTAPSTIEFAVTAIAISESQNTSSTITYSQEVSSNWGLCLYCGTNRIIWSLPDTDWLAFGVTSTYTTVYNYSPFGPPFEGSSNCSVGDSVAGTGFLAIPDPQPWQIPPATAIRPTGVGLRASVSNGTVSMTARVAFWWSV